MAVENFVRIVTTVFEKNYNSSQLAVPWSNSAMFLKCQPYDVKNIAQIGIPQLWKKAVEIFVRIVRSF